MARRSRRRTQAGFTVIEMLIAVIVTAVGFAAVFALQIGTMQGNIAAREYAAANNLAERYMEFLRSEAERWTGPNLPGPWLNQADNRWHTLTPDPVDHNGQVNAGITGNPGSNLDRQRYCVHYRLNRQPAPNSGLLEMQVRVIWGRASLGQADLDTLCPENRANNFNPGGQLADWQSLTLPGMVAIAAAPTGS
jgi:prepilin-type N-terminal cleavage/methylation domain-containing protein